MNCLQVSELADAVRQSEAHNATSKEATHQDGLATDMGITTPMLEGGRTGGASPMYVRPLTAVDPSEGI